MTQTELALFNLAYSVFYLLRRNLFIYFYIIQIYM